MAARVRGWSLRSRSGKQSCRERLRRHRQDGSASARAIPLLPGCWRQATDPTVEGSAVKRSTAPVATVHRPPESDRAGHRRMRRAGRY
jgi:hypothetical protein